MNASLKIKDLTLPHNLILAPMCGITLKPFRRLCKEYGAGLVFNQMVSARAVVMRCQKTRNMLDFDESERPIAFQLFGNESESLAAAAEKLEELRPDLIDLNLGCPAKKIVNDGGGSALLKEPEKLQAILGKMRQAIRGAFTIKIRAGWDDHSVNASDIAKLAQDEGVDAIAVHARTRSQGYSGRSDWALIKKIKTAVTIPVIGNGDVLEASDAKRMLTETGCDAVMTGRGAFRKPWIFRDYVEQTESTLDNAALKSLILKLYDYSIDYFGLPTGIKNMRKFICSYSKGIREGATFRDEIVRLNDWEEIKGRIDNFFSQ